MPHESTDSKKSGARMIIRLLRKHYPDAKCSLSFDTVHQLMVATILSAQCTDERVNMVTPDLFRKYRSVRAFADADPEELQQAIYTTGFYVNKAKAIKHSAGQLLEHYGGEIPKTISELVKLRGVGRKTASVILGAGHGLAEGVVVDTHVSRISRLLGLTREKNPIKIERDLMKIIPKPDWIDYAYLIIEHGRAICVARRPKCVDCFLGRLCPSSKAVGSQLKNK